MQENLVRGLLAGFVLISLNSLAVAQSDPETFEVGAQFALMHLSSSSGPSRWDPGFGGRFSYDVMRSLSLEAEVNFFPRESLGGVKTQGLFGVKAGWKSDKFGVFGKARPGFTRFGRVFDCPGVDRSSCDEFAYTEFSLDLGGVVEFYPSPRTVLRFDVGDTIIRYRDTKDFPFSPEFPTIPRIFEGGTRHNLQMNIGIAVRF